MKIDLSAVDDLRKTQEFQGLHAQKVMHCRGKLVTIPGVSTSQRVVLRKLSAIP